MVIVSAGVSVPYGVGGSHISSVYSNGWTYDEDRKYME